MENIESYIITYQKKTKQEVIRTWEGTGNQLDRGKLILQIQPWGRIKISLSASLPLSRNKIQSLKIYIIRKLDTTPKQTNNEDKGDLTIILIYIKPEEETTRIPGKLGSVTIGIYNEKSYQKLPKNSMEYL
ncbi:hypothetical protein C922_05453 [Plasmodium inui San Antonio 1]|uniref:Uncharacterized protein n=1 Tax=Plasmodium inui San Antonio 1 TaxID=1237626 RepID=W6ZTC4_9APIC|nr:hypothetical protein C922_05453 [Plasmodium inui San Antonio 1]EUD64172.1 hypothetical protein C922_05453 [Plasmodium inui San Antonio 1]